MDNSFQIGGRNFKLLKIPAFQQFHIVRRLGPVLGKLGPVMAHFAKTSKEESSGDKNIEAMAAFLKPVMDGLSELSDDEANKVLFGLLSAVEMQQSAGNWARLSTDSVLLFSDLELPVMLNCAGRSFMFNMSGFFQGLPKVS